MADPLVPQAVKTKTNGDVHVDLSDYGGSAVGASNAIHVQPGTGATFTVTGTVTANAGTGTFNDQHSNVTADYDTSGGTQNVTMYGIALPASGGAVAGGTVTNPIRVDVTGTTTQPVSGTVAVSGTVTVDSELPAAAALADNESSSTAVPSVGARLMGYDASGDNWDRVHTVGGKLQVDVISGGGSSSPTNPVMDPQSTSSLAAGTSADIDSTDVGSATKKLTQLILAASGPFKAILKKVADGAETAVATFFVKVGDTFVWTPPHQNFVTQGPAGAGFDGFRVSVTNTDNADPFDIYSTFVTQE